MSVVGKQVTVSWWWKLWITRAQQKQFDFVSYRTDDCMLLFGGGGGGLTGKKSSPKTDN